MKGRGIGTARGRATILRGLFLVLISPLVLILTCFSPDSLTNTANARRGRGESSGRGGDRGGQRGSSQGVRR